MVSRVGKGKEEEKKRYRSLFIMVYYSFETLKYSGIDDVFFWIVKKCSSKGLSVWIFEYVLDVRFPRGKKRKRIFFDTFQGGKDG